MQRRRMSAMMVPESISKNYVVSLYIVLALKLATVVEAL